MTRRIYPRPPIVEAIVDFRFVAEVTREELVRELATRLADRYRGATKRQDLVRVSASVREEAISTSTTKTQHVTFLCSDDGLRLLACGPRLMSVHVLAPYPGWESLVEQVEAAVEALPTSVRARGLSGVVVRYINRIVLPKEATTFSDFLTVAPIRPDHTPEMLVTFHVTTHSHDPDGTVAVLTMASDPLAPEEGPVVIYDLTIQRHGYPICELEGGAWRPVVEALHERERDIFEASMTDKARELFQ